MSPSFLLGGFVASLCMFLATASPFAKRDPLLPTEDPFYEAPAGYEDASPGAILRYRSPPSSFAAFGEIPVKLHSAWQIQYRTTDSQGNPEAAITTILIPNNANVSRLVSFQDYEDSTYLNCATSYAMLKDTGNDTLLSKLSILFIAGLLEEGYVINLPDYEGPKSSFGAGPQSGMATLDSIRAALASSSITGISKSNVDVAMWGYSGGSIATEWAAEYAPSYAPELKILGAAIGGSIVNLNNVFTTINEGQFAGFIPAGVLGLISAYNTTEIWDVLIEQTYPENITELLQPLGLCAVGDLSTFNDQDVFAYFRLGEGLLSVPELKTIVDEAGIMGVHGTPNIPLFFYKAVNDDISPVADNDALVAQYCAAGAPSILYDRNSIGNHNTDAFQEAGNAVAYLKDRFHGVTPVKGCVTNNVSLANLDLESLAGFGTEILAAMLVLFGLPLGAFEYRET